MYRMPFGGDRFFDSVEMKLVLIQRHQLKPRRVQNPVPAEAMGGVWWHHRNDIAAMSAS